MSVFFLFQASVGMAQQEAYESPAGTKFLLYTPPGYSSSTSSYPLLLSLHSKGEVGDDLSELTSNNPEQMPSRLIYLGRWPEYLPFIVLTPQLKPDPNDPENQWEADYIDEVVDYVLANYRIDHSRIYLTGISRGGTGTWTYASAYPEKIAAILTMSGRSDLTQACPIKDIPVWAFHGDGDRVAPPAYSIDMVNAIKACEPSGIYTPRLNILHARDHNGWNEIYNGSSGYKVYEWLLMFRKGDTSNKRPYVNAGPDHRIALRDDPLHIIGDFFDWDGSITNVAWKQTGGAPLTLGGTGSEFLQIRNMQPGLYEFELTVTDDKGAVNSDKVSLEITDDSVLPAVTELVLINGETGAEIGTLSEGQIIDRTALGSAEINIRANVTDGTSSVRFSVNSDQNTRTRNAAPYLIKNQTTAPEWLVKNGVYLICATAYPKDNAAGDPGVSQCYKVTITDGGTSEPCAGTGQIQHQVWTGISGTDISSIPLASEPSSVRNLSLFEAPANIDDDYGTGIRGYICPPESGNYTFWISGNDKTELWLSTDGEPANKRLIASAARYTNARQWDKYATQKSSTISLRANQRYYIEALHKEGVGSDHVAVGWQLPNGTLERPIPGMRLIPFDGSAGGTVMPVVDITSPDDGDTFTAPASVTIAANASVSEGSIAKVEFYNGSTRLGQDVTSPYTFTWSNVSAGSYSLVAKAIDSEGESSTSTVGIVVTDGAGCAGAGRIGHEIWTGISGTEISDLPLNSAADATRDLTIFEAPSNLDDNYGTRIRGYICPPASGNYTFWIAGNDRTELWLSTDQTAGNKRLIASSATYTGVREWTRRASQESSPIAVVANQRYYIEALHKEGVGSDHVAVGWRLPDGTLERPIPGMRLIPFDGSSGSTAAPVVTITNPDGGETFTAPATVAITATASDSDGSVSKVEFYSGTMKLGEDASAPYSYTWTDVPAGDYTIRAKALDNSGLSGISTVDITVLSGGSSACTGNGTILREVWTDVPYPDVASIPVNSSPDGASELTLFEDPSNAGDNYGTRVSGYICVPATGDYTFWISSNDHSELWLSTDSSPANKRRIAYVNSYTGSRQWDKYTSQQSLPIHLEEGQRYYIEALHKEGVGSDHMAVGWQLPDGTLERPIPGGRLSPFEPAAVMTTFTGVETMATQLQSTTISTTDNLMGSEGINNESELHIYPNPASAGVPEVRISGLPAMSNGIDGRIEIQRVTGEIAYSAKFNCGFDCTDYLIPLSEELTPGVYLVNVITNRRKVSERFFIK